MVMPLAPPFTLWSLLLLKGKSSRDREFDINGSKVNKVFNAFGAISAVVVANTSGLLLEIQVNYASYHGLSF